MFTYYDCYLSGNQHSRKPHALDGLPAPRTWNATNKHLQAEEAKVEASRG
jgi:hypothetical protein